MVSSIRNEIHEAAREEVSRLLGSSTSNESSSELIRSTPNSNLNSGARDTSISSNSANRTLSFDDFYRMREHERQQGFKPPSKKKKKASSTSRKFPDVEIKVGVAAQCDGKIKMRRGKTHLVSINTEADKEEIIRKAVAKHTSFDQSFDETLAYVLLYPDFREVQHIPGTTQLFNLSKYKEAIGKDYKRLTFYLIPLDDIEECASDGEPGSVQEGGDGNSALSPNWSRFGFLHKPAEVVEIQEMDQVTTHSLSSCSTRENNRDDGLVSNGLSTECLLSVPALSSGSNVNSSLKEVECPTCFISFPIENIVQHADMCASWLVQSDDTSASTSEISDHDAHASNEIKDGDLPEITFASLIKQLQNNLMPGDPVRINVRRKTLLEDFIGQRKRRVKPENKIKIVFVGEPAIDDGGPRREFFSGV